MTEQEKQELNEKLARHFLGIKKIYYQDWDVGKKFPYYIPSGKPWRTHQIDAKPIPDFTDPNYGIAYCFKLLIPKSHMDTLWIINNLDSPTPKIEYCFGFVRGGDNDLICWSKDLPVEECLSPVCEIAGEAICLAIEKLIDAKGVG